MRFFLAAFLALLFAASVQAHLTGQTHFEDLKLADLAFESDVAGLSDGTVLVWVDQGAYIRRPVFYLFPLNGTLSEEGAAIELKQKCLLASDLGVDSQVCYSRELYDIAKKEGNSKAFGVLLKLQKLDPSTYSCHLLAHYIGRGSYEHDPANWRDVLERGDTACSYGMAHGVLEAYFDHLGSVSISDDDVLRSTCEGDAPSSCYHVIGHVLIVDSGRDINASLGRCNIFSEQWQKESCYDGVFMEEVNPVTLKDHGLANDSDLDLVARLPKLKSMCDSFDDDGVVKTCWGGLAPAILATFDYNPVYAFDYCANAPAKEAERTCRRASIEILVLSNNLDLKSTSRVCTIPMEGNPDFEASCYGIIANAAVQVLPAARRGEAVDFCSSLESRFREYCFRTIGATSGRINGEERARLCGLVPGLYRDSCFGSVN